MPTPIVISTWRFGLPANEAAWQILTSNGTALDSVVVGATQCEDDPTEHSVGLGGLPDAAGEVTLDACVMDHLGHCGAVACMKRVRNAAQVARLVMQLTPHVMLAGEGATQFALLNGMQETNLLTEQSAKRYAQWKQTQEEGQRKPAGHDTLGILALDSAGRLAGACTTSGLAFKLPGRVGDSPIIGAGLFVDGEVGAVTATGQGEEMIRTCGSHAILENLRRGMEPQAAIRTQLQRLYRLRGNGDADVSFLVLRADGAYAGMSLRSSTKFCYAVIHPAMNQIIDAPALVGAI